MTANSYVLETFQEKHITGTLVLKETKVSHWETWRDYEVQFCNYPNLVNPLLAVKHYEILEMLSILSKVKDAIDRWEEKAAAEDEALSYA
jgi:hypothetical protein